MQMTVLVLVPICHTMLKDKPAELYRMDKHHKSHTSACNFEVASEQFQITISLRQRKTTFEAEVDIRL